MLKNSQMIGGRFARWARYRARERWIKSHLNAGRTVYVKTAARITKLTARNDGGVHSTRNEIWLRRGQKSRDDISFCGFEVR